MAVSCCHPCAVAMLWLVHATTYQTSKVLKSTAAGGMHHESHSPPQLAAEHIKSSAKMAFSARLSAALFQVFTVSGLFLIHIDVIRLRVGQQRPLFDLGDEGVLDPLARVGAQGVGNVPLHGQRDVGLRQ